MPLRNTRTLTKINRYFFCVVTGSMQECLYPIRPGISVGEIGERKVARQKVKPTETLGDALRAERDRRGMTQKEAGKALGVSQPVFSAWENDQNEPGGKYLPAITSWLRSDDKVVGRQLYWSKIARAEVDLAAAARRQRS